MSFHPETIATLAEWNARMCGCCNMPACLSPELETRSALVTYCTFQFDDPEEGWSPRFAKNTQGRIGDGSYNNLVADVSVGTQTVDFTITYTDTFDPPYTLTGICTPVRTCNIMGTIDRVDKSYYTTSGSGETLTITSGPFVSFEFTATVTNMAGMPDPTWTPGEDETEEDRPILAGPCAPVWTYTIKTYDPIIEAGLYTGSTLDTNITAYFKDTMGGTQSPIGGVGIPFVSPVSDYADELSCADLLALLADIAEEDLTVIGGAEVETFFECPDPGTGAAARVQQYRWIIPPCHPGSWYKIEWDEVFFPQAYLDWLADAQASEDGIEVFDPNADPPPELPTITAKSYTWTGTALGSCYEPEASDYVENYDERRAMSGRKSPWSLALIPTAAGRIELRNAIVQCYRSPYGNKPQPLFIPGSYSTADVDQDGINDADEPIAPPP